MKHPKRLALVIYALFSLSCVQETHLKTVTFIVDMSTIKNPENVGLRGNFTSNPWNETAPLTDSNNDGIYEGTFSQKTAANQIQFKFVNNNSDYELRGLDNRIIEFTYEPETITYKAVFNNSTDVNISKD